MEALQEEKEEKEEKEEEEEEHYENDFHQDEEVRYPSDAMIIKYTTPTKEKRLKLAKEGKTNYLALQTHLTIEREGLTQLELPETQVAKEWGIKACKNLQILYLNENRLPCISELMLKFTKLQRLSLHNNQITKIENLESLVNL